MSNHKIEIIRSLEELENKKKNIQLVELALESAHFEDATMSVTITTRDYKHKGTDESIPINPDLFLDYIKSEIKDINTDIRKCIDQLNTKYLIDTSDHRR